MGSEPVKLNNQSYSLKKGLVSSLQKTVIPAVGAALVGLLVDPQFVLALQDHFPLLASGGAGGFALLLLVNWAKNKNLGK